MLNLNNKEIMLNKYDISITKTKRGPARIHPNVSEGLSSKIATAQEILSIAILDQLITLNETMADTQDILAEIEIKK